MIRIKRSAAHKIHHALHNTEDTARRTPAAPFRFNLSMFPSLRSWRRRSKYHLRCDNGTRSRVPTFNRRLLATIDEVAQIACRIQEDQRPRLGISKSSFSVSVDRECNSPRKHRPCKLAKKSRRGSRSCRYDYQYRGQAFSCANSRHLRSTGVFPRRFKVRHAVPPHPHLLPLNSSPSQGGIYGR